MKLRGFLSVFGRPSMKVPPKRKGNNICYAFILPHAVPSMKVPPKRKGNRAATLMCGEGAALNESPSEKEGK